MVLANMKATAATIPLTGKDGFVAFEKQARLLEEFVFPWKFYESLARQNAEKKGGYFLTSEQQLAVDRFLDFEKTAQVEGIISG